MPVGLQSKLVHGKRLYMLIERKTVIYVCSGGIRGCQIRILFIEIDVAVRYVFRVGKADNEHGSDEKKNRGCYVDV